MNFHMTIRIVITPGDKFLIRLKRWILGQCPSFFCHSMPSALYTSSGRYSGFDAADSTPYSSVSLGRSPTIRTDRNYFYNQSR